MPQVKAAKNVYPASSKLLPKKLDEDLQKKSQIESEDCPWVKVGNVYLSVSETGEYSWAPVARLCYDTDKKKNFTVFTGRHGDYLNPYEKGDCKVFDADHFEQDKERAKEVKGYLKDIVVKVLDTSGHPKDQAKWLKEESLKALKAGDIVIYAWCYSLFTFSEIALDPLKAIPKPGAGKMILNSHILAMQAKSIADVVKDWYHWVPV